MSDDQQTCFEAWLRTNCANLTCVLCQSVRWKICDLLTPAHVNPLHDAETQEPVLAQLVCKTCAYVLLFDVRHIRGWHGECVADTTKTMIF
jgi:hypothetical protein